MKPWIGEPQKKRLKSLVITFLWASLSVFCFYKAFSNQVHAYITPKEIIQKVMETGNTSKTKVNNVRLGGLVEKGSIKSTGEGGLHFVASDINDIQYKVKIYYKGGELPAMFKEGEMMLAEGRMENDIFIAKRILAKHDENYQPKKKSVA